MGNWLPEPRDLASVLAVAERIKEGDDYLIVTHERPDGDALGSALATAHMLQEMGKQWRFMVAEPMPIRFSYLPGFGRAVVKTAQPDRQFRHVIAVDCADMARFPELTAYMAADSEVINIDHHRTNPRYGVAALVDEHAAATCELLYHVAMALSVPLQQDLATCLYTGLLTDTGGFSLPNTTREVLQIAAALLESGVKPYDVAEPALESRTWEQMRLMQLALNNLTVSADGRYAALYVTRGMLEGAGATDDDAEGLVGFARSIDTVEVGILFRETPDERVKVSLRSKRLVDVAQIAQAFGGGGHIRAAGCTLSGPLDEAIDQVILKVEEALEAVQ
jgi:bifunctional oligoribonuclease and PAP phosphatase NrnA